MERGLPRHDTALRTTRRQAAGRRAAVVIAAVVAVAVVARPGVGASVQAQVGLGTLTSFAVLGGQTVTNTGTSVLNGDLGVSPGTAITGFPPGIVNGVIHAADAVAAQAQSDLTIAYNDAAGRAPDANLSGQDLGGKTLTAGAYKFDAAAQLTGTVTLDGQGNPDAVFIFQIGSTLTTATSATVALQNLAQACHVFWQVGSSATLGTNTTFVGDVLALTSITAVTGANVLGGRLLARNGAVTLDANVVTRSVCAPGTTTTTAGGGGATTTTAGGGAATTTTTTAGGGAATTTTTTALPGTGAQATTTTSTTPGGGGAATTTTTPGTGILQSATTTTSTAGAGTTTSTTARAQSTPTPTPIGLGGGGSTPRTSTALPVTGGRAPAATLALAALLLVAGAALQTATRRRSGGIQA